MENIVYVYNKNGELIATFDGDGEGLDEVKKRNMMIAPTVHIETNGASTLSFQMLVNTEKWQTIKDPENYYYLNGRYYTALNDGSYEYVGDGTVRYVNVTLVETWYLLDKKFTQVYNCGIYCYAKAYFVNFEPDCAIFKIFSSDCSNPSNTISTENAWHQVRLWQTHIDDTQISYPILVDEDYKPENWDKTPAAVFFDSFDVSGDSATVVVKSRSVKKTLEQFKYSSTGFYEITNKPYPSKIDSIIVNSTITKKNEDSISIETSEKEISFDYDPATGEIRTTFRKQENETISSIECRYDFYDLGDLKLGATCYFAYGAEVVDEHTVIVLPKADTKHKLTIDGVEYEDSEVRDITGRIMPRGSGGYALWAVLKNSGWKLGVCDVIAKGFDTSIDYGCFNIESDMKDVLYNIQYIQELYGGILDWNSKEKVLNYRAENSEDYDSYNDGFNDWTGYEFRHGKNLIDQPSITVDNNLLTKAYLLGYGNLNVKKVNGDKTYIEDYSYTGEVYEGYLEQPLIYDTNDDGGMKQLLYWGRKELAKRCRPRKTISVNGRDIRSITGYEHEVFDINDVVRVYYKDSETGQEVYEEKRINLWEYNAFAMYDCSVEMGDKTQNLAQLFKLIYNKAVEDAPSTDASGNISGVNVDLGLSGAGIGGYGFGSDIFGGANVTFLPDYIALIARTVTDTSEAVAGLILQTTSLYAKAELFASYKKYTDELFSESYAGLVLYAKEKSAEAVLTAKNYTNDYVAQQISSTSSELKLYADNKIAEYSAVVDAKFVDTSNSITNLQVQTEAGFRAQASQNKAFTEQFANFESTLRDTENGITEITNSFTQYKQEVTRTYATITSLASYAKTTYVDGEIKSVTNSLSEFKQEANETFAKTSILVSYAKTSYVDNKIGNLGSYASIQAYADANFASVDIEAKVNDNVSHFSVSSTQITMYSGSGQYGSKLILSSTSATLGGTSYETYLYGSRITLNSVGKMLFLCQGNQIEFQAASVKIGGKTLGWTFDSTLGKYVMIGT